MLTLLSSIQKILYESLYTKKATNRVPSNTREISMVNNNKA